MDEIQCSHTESVTSFTLNKINNDGAMKMNEYAKQSKPNQTRLQMERMNPR